MEEETEQRQTGTELMAALMRFGAAPPPKLSDAARLNLALSIYLDEEDEEE